jgi:hypothetical protein
MPIISLEAFIRLIKVGYSAGTAKTIEETIERLLADK